MEPVQPWAGEDGPALGRGTTPKEDRKQCAQGGKEEDVQAGISWVFSRVKTGAR